MRSRLSAVFFLLILMAQGAQGQDTTSSDQASEGSLTIQGKVTDALGDPLPGATVKIVDTHYGSFSDKHGDYAFPVPASQNGQKVNLRASFVGYVTESIPLTLLPGTFTQNFQLQRDVLKLGTISVTAQKRREDLQKVPISISAIDADRMEQMAAEELLDLEYTLPNLKFGDNGSLSPELTVRGIHSGGGGMGIDSRSVVFVDGVYAGRKVAFNQDLLDIEQVEFLRGPQGTLFGKNTIAGAINLTTRKPHGRFGGELAVEAGNFHHTQIRAIINVPLIQNRLFAKASGKRVNRNGFIKNLHTGKDLHGEDTFAGRLQFRYLASEALEWNLSFNGLRNRADPSLRGIAILGPGFDLAPDSREVNHDAEEFKSRDRFSSTLSADYNLPRGYAVRSVSSYHVDESNSLGDLDYTDTFVAATHVNRETRHFAQEIRLASPQTGKRLNFVGGLYYVYEKAKDVLVSNGGPAFFIPDSRVETFGHVRTHSVAGYVHGNVRISDKLTLTSGIRYTYEDKEIDYSIHNEPAPILFVELDHFTDDYNKKVLSPKGGVNFQASDQLLIYGSIARGFKSGGWAAIFLRTDKRIRVDPEFVTSYEVGFKSATPDNRFRLNAAAYVSKFNDYQIRQVLRFSQEEINVVLTNAGKVTSRGGEVELSILPVSGLAIRAGLGLTKARFDEYRDGGGIGIHYDDNKVGGAPDIEYNLALDYRKRLGRAGSIVLHGDFVYRGGYFTDSDNERTVEAHHLLNARAGFETAGGNWGLFFGIRNVTNQLYVTGTGGGLLNTETAWFGKPRTYTLKLSYRFSK